MDTKLTVEEIRAVLKDEETICWWHPRSLERTRFLLWAFDEVSSERDKLKNELFASENLRSATLADREATLADLRKIEQESELLRKERDSVTHAAAILEHDLADLRTKSKAAFDAVVAQRDEAQKERDEWICLRGNEAQEAEARGFARAVTQAIKMIRLHQAKQEKYIGASGEVEGDASAAYTCREIVRMLTDLSPSTEKIAQNKPESTPIPMLLACPVCKTRHIDSGEWETKPHRDHACQMCGMVWRPALVCTTGVRFLPGYKNDERETKS